ncbi:uncharacterized protein LOC125205982 [Salvia hispanica]|uniref:uncharacterized protein LOC125205982 n=1 Tax=Salvia hispanica TaxID=49212 RepID=UPI0020091372|nr:uncharacterized protein LOC125205982 [Salvia hispanica]XP_047961181.1 uncharacterized protein LOC125205982 [Salvia hispanica]XP_047961182.1 uncharacterized protein LOC125205982 [Salvia hispanica]
MEGRRSLRLQSMKAHVKHEKKEKMEMQSSWATDAEKPCTSNRSSIRERKLTLQQDVDKLKKRLRHEENVHRALERAFTRPLGALPRLPPYLPQHTLELLAEVAVLEEEIVRLEEKIVFFRKGLYQEAVYISSSKKMDTKDEQKQSTFLVTSKTDSETGIWKDSTFLSDDKRGKENQSSTSTSKNKKQSVNSKVQPSRNPVKKRLTESKSGERRLDPQRSQWEMQLLDQATTPKTTPANLEATSPVDGSPNKISESILKCLINIYLRLSSMKNRNSTESLPSQTVAYSFDPYNLCSMFGKRDIGPYKHLMTIEAASIDPNRTTISVFLVQRLKLLFRKLATVSLKDLSHQEKLAFWINIYNSCMMNAFLEYGIPEDPEMVFELMQKATVTVSEHVLTAITIEHFILRLPYHSKYTSSKSTKNDETMARSMFGLELSEPFVTFALSCGSWSSPAVRVYTASRVESELETAKREYLQAAVGISTIRKVIAIPKLMDWYLLDFAKDFESLVDWICLQLPSELAKEAITCLESRKDLPPLKSIQILPYEFSFRYLFHT